MVIVVLDFGLVLVDVILIRIHDAPQLRLKKYISQIDKNVTVGWVDEHLSMMYGRIWRWFEIWEIWEETKYFLRRCSQD